MRTTHRGKAVDHLQWGGKQKYSARSNTITKQSVALIVSSTKGTETQGSRDTSQYLCGGLGDFKDRRYSCSNTAHTSFLSLDGALFHCGLPLSCQEAAPFPFQEDSKTRLSAPWESSSPCQ